jgi:hypothetical protein
MIRLIFVAVALLFSSFSFSSEYLWFVQNYGPTNSFSTPKLACEYAGSKYVYGGQSYAYFSHSITANSIYGYCVIKSVPSGWSNTMTLERSGTSCASGSTYNPATGICDLPLGEDGTYCNGSADEHSTWGIDIWSDGVCKPIDQAKPEAKCKILGSRGKPEKFTRWKYPDKPEADQPDTFSNKDGCIVETVMTDNCIDKPAVCDIPVDGVETYCSEHASKCVVSAKLTGGYLANADGNPLCLDSVSYACIKQEPKLEVVELPCKFTLDPQGLSVCGSSVATSKEGTTNCGTFNGVFSCSTVKPSSKGISLLTKIKTDTETEPGKKIETTTKTQVASTCEGAKKETCTTKSTTITSITKTNVSTGEKESVTGTCIGANCPDKNGNPDADGDGFGDCTKDCGEEEEQGTASTSGDCTVPPPCDGDAFQCAILQQVALSSCLERALPTAAEKQEFDALSDAAYAANDQNQSDLDSKVNGLLSGLKTASSGNVSNGSGACLPDYPIAFLGKTIVMEFSALCPYLAIFRFGLLFIAYLGAARIVSTQL